MDVTSEPTSSIAQNWRTLYLAALFEKDRARIRERIHNAELALSSRARELFAASTDREELRQ